MSNGFNAFVFKLANKIVEIQKRNQEANNVLESIPDWADFVEGDLKSNNDKEAKPLGSDPRKRAAVVEDDIESFFKIKGFGSGYSNVKLKSSKND